MFKRLRVQPPRVGTEENRTTKQKLPYMYIYTFDELLLGTAIAPHDIVSTQGLPENMEILKTTFGNSSRSHNVTQGPHKVPHW